MKKIFLAVGISLLGLGVVTAQQKVNQNKKSQQNNETVQKVERSKVNHRGNAQMQRGSMESPESRVQKLDEIVQLKPEQKKKLLELYKTSHSKMQNENANMNDRRAMQKEIREQTNQILTPEQREKWENRMQERTEDKRMKRVPSSERSDRGVQNKQFRNETK
ncbi:MAG TPA: hypothetical protein VK027_03685 [Chitinophagaceae bacterium]|nr:hypothetical protein [Chitinophagaceae bacterium]